MDRETADRLFRSGRFIELLRQIDPRPSVVAKIPQDDLRVLIAHALVHVGDLEAAQTIIDANNTEGASAAARARCDVLLGLLANRRADVGTASRFFQRGARRALEARVVEQAAWCHVYLLRMMAEAQSQEELAALLVQARRLVAEVGNPHLSAFLHDTVALREAQIGRLDEARRHLRVANAILESCPNAWIQQLLHLSASCVAWLSCEFREAIAHSDSARQLGQVTGEEYLSEALDVNDGHYLLNIGRLGKAKERLARISRSNEPILQMAARDGIARLSLILNSLDECEVLLAGSGHERDEATLTKYYSLRWAAVCRARLLVRRGHYEAALAETRKGILVAGHHSNSSLVLALTLVEAEALARCGLQVQAGKKLLEVAALGVTSVRELHSSFYETCYRVLDSFSNQSVMFRERALRIWKAQGHILGQLELLSYEGIQLEVKTYTQSAVDRLLSKVAPKTERRTGAVDFSAAHVLDSLVNAFEMSFSPSLAAAELKSVAGLVGCAEHVVVEPRRRDDPSDEDAHSARLGSDSEADFVVVVRPSEDASVNVFLGDFIRLTHILDEFARGRRDVSRRTALWPETPDSPDGSMFVADEMVSLAAIARRVAPSNVPVLITGETGTGKEILARAIHAHSTRAAAVFLPFNCSVGPRDTIDAQLFGHRRGAFTGATEHAPGILRSAAGGTLFLDEIGEAPLDVQPKLLRFLESGEIHPLGEPQPTRVDVRVIAATNVDLDAMVSAGRFREDLFYRLNIVRLHVPPLRERRVEIPVFAQHYLQRHAREQGKGDLRLAEETMEYLLLYRWPGNVRQLANEMRRVAALAETDAVVMPEHLSRAIVASRRTVPASERTLDPTEVVVRLDQPMAAAIEHLQRAMYQYGYRVANGRLEETARRLGLTRKGLYLMRQRLGLESEAPARSA